MKIILNKTIPFGKRYYAVNLFGVLFAKGPCSPQTINHEKIHTAQIKELLFIFFYIWYGIEWVFKLIVYRNSFLAYKNISFEREAYANGLNPEYLKGRKRFAFVGYIIAASNKNQKKLGD